MKPTEGLHTLLIMIIIDYVTVHVYHHIRGQFLSLSRLYLTATICLSFPLFPPSLSAFMHTLVCHHPLRYWTDNGACYYYNTGNYSNYEEVLVAVKEDAVKEGLPYRYLQVQIAQLHHIAGMCYQAENHDFLHCIAGDSLIRTLY